MEANYLERPVMPAAARNMEAARLLRCRAMSALGQKWTLQHGAGMSAPPPRAGMLSVGRRL